MKYIDESHSYINDEGEKYTSVTTLIKKYEPKKDWDAIAQKYAKKKKRPVEEVQAEWKEESRKSIEKGLLYHAKKENELITKGSVNIEGVDYKVIHTPAEDGVKLAIPLNLDDGVYPELIVYSHKYKIGGQADLVEIVDNKINIKDYKTSKEIKLESFKNWRGEHEMLLHPVNHLMNCNFYTYGLQLNIYMYLLKTHNRAFDIGTMEIQHIKDDEIILHTVPNLQREARALLDHHYGEFRYSF